MDTVLIAIASPAKAELDDTLVNSIMDKAGIEGPVNWLSKGEAIEIPFQSKPGFDALENEMAIRSMLAGLAIDIAFVPSQNRKKKLLIADMDSTIIAQECIDELGDFAGVGDEAKQITARAMAGELDFEGALAARLNLMKGLPEEFITKVIDTRLTLTPGARTLVQTMKNNGAITALVSGGFIQFVSHIAAQCGFDEHQANTLEIIQGKLTGNVPLAQLAVLVAAAAYSVQAVTARKIPPMNTLQKSTGVMLASAIIGVFIALIFDPAGPVNKNI